MCETTILYSVYKPRFFHGCLSDIWCTHCTLYSLYAVHCTVCTLYNVYGLYKLYSLYSVEQCLLTVVIYAYCLCKPYER